MTRRSSALALALPSLFDEPAETPVLSITTHQVKVRAHRRTVRGEPGPTGRHLREAALSAHGARPATAIALEYVRAALRERYRLRLLHWPHKPETHYVTAEDADEIITAWADCPSEVLALPTQKWRGALFNPLGWVKTGRRVKSERAGMHANDLCCWQPREDRR